MTKELLIGAVHEAAYLLKKDLAATSDAILTEKPADKMRPMTSLVAEVADFNTFAASLVGGTEFGNESDAEREARYASVTTSEEATRILDESVAALTGALAAAPEESLADQVTAPWGQPMSKAQMVLFSVCHTFYHDGQLNYLQLMKGDDKIHWMDA